MSSYKCPQCGLINWNTAEMCKRCAAPNPFLQNYAPENFQPQAAVQDSQAYSQPQQHASQNTAMYPTQHTQAQQYQPQDQTGYYQPQPQYAAAPNYAAPPPPNVFGASAGQAQNVGPGNWQQPIAQSRPYQQQYHDPGFELELAAASKHIRNAWICGVVVCSLGLLATFVLSAIGPETTGLEISVPFMIVAILIYAGLTAGVYHKSRACAVILLCLYILDKIAQFAESGKFQGAIFAFIIIAYFAYGVKGTFDYHKLIEKQQKAY